MGTIDKYSLRRFIRLCGCNDLYMSDGCMVSRGSIPTGYNSPFIRMNECFILLCKKGEMQVTMNGQEYIIHPHSLFVYSSNSMIQIECNENCSFICIIPTPDYLMQYYSYWKQVVPLMMRMKNSAVILLKEAETVRYERMANCVLDCMQNSSQSEWTHDAMLSGMKMLLCSILGKIKIFTEYNNKGQERKYPSRSEEYFSRFMKLLYIHYKQERKVEFYASELCITSKYLSAMIKKFSGKTPARWIDEVVMEEVDYLLKNSNISIKEIAYQLNFSNSSFFGKYVKRYTGVSPHRYRTCNIPAMFPSAVG